MDKKKIEILLVVTLVPVLFFLLFGKNMPSQKRGGKVGMSSDGAMVGATIADFDMNVQLFAGDQIDETIEEIVEETVSEGWDRNPFEIMVSTEIVEVVEEEESSPNEPSFVILGIAFDPDITKASVIIEGNFFRLGEIVDGWEIKHIEMNRVWFRSVERDVEYIYNLYESDRP